MAKATFEVTFSKLKKKQFNEQVEVLQDVLSSCFAEIADDEGLKFKSLALQGADIPQGDGDYPEENPCATIEWDGASVLSETVGPPNYYDQEPVSLWNLEGASGVDTSEAEKNIDTELKVKLTGVHVTPGGNITIEIPEGYALTKVN